MPEHHLITDPYIHEPKGVATAPAGQIYISNGSGSGSWVYWPFGHALYVHSTTGQVINTTPSKLLIDGDGSGVTNRLPREIRGSGTLWDGVTSKMTPVRQYDGYDFRLQLPISSTTGTPTSMSIQVDYGGQNAPTDVAVIDVVPLLSGASGISFNSPLYAALTAMQNGIQVFLSVDSGSVVLGAPRVYIVKTIDGNI